MINLRPANINDKDNVYNWLSNPTIAKEMYVSDDYEKLIMTREDFFNDYNDDFFNKKNTGDNKMFIICDEREDVGCISSSNTHLKEKTAEIDIWLKDISLSSKGYGSQAIKILAEMLFAKGFELLIIRPHKDNARAIKAYQKAGFKIVEEEKRKALDIFLSDEDTGDHGIGNDVLMIREKKDVLEKAWYKEGVVYQIYPRSFYDKNNDGIGDILGIIEKIPYLKDLGVDIVWLSPVYKSPMEDNGYDISDYKSIASEFGNMEDMKKLIKEFHKAGIKLVMDLVINHTSNQHPWFIKSENKEGKYTDYYHWEKKKRNWTSFFGGSAWEYSKKREEYYLHLFAKGQPDLNWDNELVRTDIKEMIKFWLDLGVDGFRCDVINIIAKDPNHPNGKFKLILKGSEHYFNNPKLHDYLEELNRDVFSKYDCFTVGETVFVNPKGASDLVNPNRNELNMLFQFDHMAADNHFVKWFIKKFKPINLKKALSKWQNELNGWNTLYLENHDQGRSISRFGDMNFYYQSATLLATIIYFQQGTPFIYQGQEIGMTNAHYSELTQYQDIETHNIYKLGRKLLMSHKRMMKKIKLMSRDNARTPMQWDDEFYAGFSKNKPWLEVNDNYKIINVKKNQESDKSILKYYKKIIELRHKEDVIVYGDYEDIDFKNKKVYAYKRILDDKELYVLCNFSNKVIKIKDYDFLDNEVILKNYPNTVKRVMQPYEARVYLKK